MPVIVIKAVNYFANFLEIVIFARVLLSWIPLRRDNGLIRMVYVLSEPVLGPIRAAIRRSPLGGPGMMLDFSPIIAFALIEVVKSLVINIIIKAFL